MAVSTECPASPDGNRGEGLRSLWHLSRHLTARADDNHAAPSHWSEERAVIIELNHMFLRLCGPPSIPLSFTVAGVLPRWDTYRFRLVTDSLSPTTSIHRLLCGLPGYLILFDTRTFEPQRQYGPRRLPSQSGFFVISKHFTATPRIPPSSCRLKTDSFNCSPTVEPPDFTTDLSARLRSL